MAFDFLTAGKDEVKQHIDALLQEARDKPSGKKLGALDKLKALKELSLLSTSNLAEAFVTARNQNSNLLSKSTPENYAKSVASDFEKLLVSKYSSDLEHLSAVINITREENTPEKSTSEIAAALSGTSGNIPNFPSIRSMALEEGKKHPPAQTVTPDGKPAEPSAPSAAPAAAGAAAAAVKPAKAKPAAGGTPNTSPPAQTTTPSGAAPSTAPAKAAAPKSKIIPENSPFHKVYQPMQEAGSMAYEVLSAYNKAKANNNPKDLKEASEAIQVLKDQMSAGLAEKIGAELKAKKIDATDKDVKTLADTTATETLAFMQERMASGMLDKNSIRDVATLNNTSDILATRVRNALASKDLGALNDSMLHPIDYLDVIVGAEKNGAITGRQGMNLHGLGSTMLAEAFGTDAIKTQNKEQLFLNKSKADAHAKGETLDAAAIDGSIDSVLGTNYSGKTKNAVRDIAKKGFGDTSVGWGDLNDAWDKMAEEGRGNWMTRLIVFIDALCKTYLNFSFMGEGNNPILQDAQNIANERRLANTYQGIMQASAESLGVAENEKQRLAERVTGRRLVNGKLVEIDAEGNVGAQAGLSGALNGVTSNEPAPAAPPPQIKAPVLADSTEITPEKKQGLVKAIAQLQQDNKDNPAFAAMIGTASIRPTLLPNDTNAITEKATREALKDGKVDANEMKVIAGLNKALKDAGLESAVIPITKEGDYQYTPPTAKNGASASRH